MLIELEETFDSDGFLKLQNVKIPDKKSQVPPDFLTADQVYRKLSAEIL